MKFMTPVIETAGTITTFKLCGYATAVAIFEYLNITDTQFCILGALMIVDFIFGIGKQYVINKQEITSHKAWLGSFKKVSTLLVFLSIALMFKGINVDGTFYLNAIISIFIMAETYSIIQNVYTIRTGKVITEYDAISKVLIFIQNIISRSIDKKLEDLDFNKNKKGK